MGNKFCDKIERVFRKTVYNFNNADIRPNYEDIVNIDDLYNDSITRHFSDVDEHVIKAIIKKSVIF